MTDGKCKIFRYVPHNLIPSFVELGWEYRRALEGTHHGHTASLLEWPHDRPPEEPEMEVPLAG